MIGEYRSDYVIKSCGNGVFKVIRFKRGSGVDYIKIDDTEYKSNDNKLDNNICRSRSRVLELALCNDWEWFVTLTLDSAKYNRYDLEKFKKDLSRWIRNQRRNYKTKFQFLLIPEAHKDGAWHMHGLFNGIPYSEVKPFEKGIHPDKLVKSGYMNFPAYSEKFGFCSMGRIRDKAKCAFYISKYISKDLSDRVGDLGKHLYDSSKPLKGYVDEAYINGSVPELDALLVNHGEFCSTGYVFNEVETFPTRYDDEYNYKPIKKEKEDVKETDFLFIADVINEDDLIKIYA